MKTHLNLATADLDRAVSFYSILLNTKPIKALPDYALFVTEQPALELALDLRGSVSPTSDAHYGIYVETPAEVNRAIERLNAAGLAASVEREQTCCYASQTKVWAVDPDGRHWEVYTVHDDTDERNGDDITGCSSDPQARSCCS
jgi:catechol 2,3-dioxygenase-like lactoylglutathione lyase family enzyme